MDSLSVFEFTSFRQYLQYVRKYKLARRKRPLTLMLLAERLGYNSPRTLGMVLKGQRAPSEEMVSRLIENLRLDRREARYLRLLVELERRRKNGQATEDLIQDIEELNPKAAEKLLIDAKAFSYIAEWYHVVIKQMIETPGFNAEAAAIREKLRNKVTESEARRALENLIQLGLVARDESSGRLRLAKGDLATSSGIPDAAIRLHHGQMLDRAKEALVELPVEERFLTAVTLRLHRSQLEEAVKMVCAFRDQFDKRFSQSSSDQVYQLNIQLFPHTR